jgi:DnaJ-class molecular chaperone
VTLYEILGLSADCTSAEIEDAYRARRSTSGHSGLLGWIVQSLRLIADIDYAYFILSDVQRRHHYDRSPHDFLEFHHVPIVV